MDSHNIWPFVSGFLHSAVLARVIHAVAVSVLFSFLRLDNVPLYGWTTSRLSIHPLVDICLHLLGFMNRAAVNMLSVYLLKYLVFSFFFNVFIYFGCVGSSLWQAGFSSCGTRA